MLQIDVPETRKSLFQGQIGLELEGWRVYNHGTIAKSRHPFENNDHIITEVYESILEIITSPEPTAQEAVQALARYKRQVHEVLEQLPKKETLWPISSPPVLRDDDPARIAWSTVSQEKQEYYRLAVARYGWRMLSFIGIHVNISFSEELLQHAYAAEIRSVPSEASKLDFRSFSDRFYLELAEKAEAFSWILVMLTAASPIGAQSYYDQGTSESTEKDVFTGDASLRCSAAGFWNTFVPVLDYSELGKYIDVLQRYLDEGMLNSLGELYLPARLKSKGKNTLSSLINNGISHIELRMFDLNPFTQTGVDVRDIQFTQLLLIWLASMPRRSLSPEDQRTAIQNAQNAAKYDLSDVTIRMPEFGSGSSLKAEQAALWVIDEMTSFYKEIEAMNRMETTSDTSEMPDWVFQVLDFEQEKMIHPETRYAHRIRKEIERRNGMAFIIEGPEMPDLLAVKDMGKV